MSLVVLKTYDDNLISAGKMIVLVEDSGVWEAKEFDEKTDSLSDVVGVSYAKTNNGRLTGNADGFYYNDADFYQFNEDLSPDYETTNTNFNPSFNPVNDDSYIYLCNCGMVAVSTAYTAVPSTYKKIRNGTNFNLYII